MCLKTPSYFNFSRIANEENGYRLRIGGYRGNATDSLSAHDGYSFSTVDRNNDRAPTCCPCVPAYGGGWWFYRY
jgi:ficolin